MIKDFMKSLHRLFGRHSLKLSQIAQRFLIVIPAKAGIQVFPRVLDPGFRRGDGVSEF